MRAKDHGSIFLDVNPRNRSQRSGLRRADIKIRRAKENLRRPPRVAGNRFVAPCPRKAQITLSTAVTIRGNGKRRIALPIGPDIRMPARVVVQLYIGAETRGTSNAATVVSVKVQRRQQAGT